MQTGGVWRYWAGEAGVDLGRACPAMNALLSARNTHPIAANGYDSAAGHVLLVGCKQTFKQPYPLRSRRVGQANDPAMRLAFCENQCSEVFVQRHEHPALGERLGEQLLVARIGAALARFGNVVTFASQPLRERCARASVNQELHPPTRTASSESLAITAWA